MVLGTFLSEINLEKDPLGVAKWSYKCHDSINFMKKGIFVSIGSETGRGTAELKVSGPARLGGDEPENRRGHRNMPPPGLKSKPGPNFD
jgi:hypothetical protein